MAKKANYKKMVELFNSFIKGQEEMFNNICSEQGHPSVFYDNPTEKDWRLGISKRTKEWYNSFFMPIEHYGCFMGEDGPAYEPRPHIVVFNYTLSSKNPNRHILSVIGTVDNVEQSSTITYVYKNGNFERVDTTSQDMSDFIEMYIAAYGLVR